MQRSLALRPTLLLACAFVVDVFVGVSLGICVGQSVGWPTTDSLAS